MQTYISFNPCQWTALVIPKSCDFCSYLNDVSVCLRIITFEEKKDAKECKTDWIGAAWKFNPKKGNSISKNEN